MKTYTVAIVGATGAVGRSMVRVLEERAFPVKDVVLLASGKSAGSTLQFEGREVLVQELHETAFEGCDIALFSAGGDVSRLWAPVAVDHGCLVIDNSSAFRMNPEVPLIVPEVNPGAIADRPIGIIANPNCSTIQMVVALKPLHDAFGVARVVVSTYQAVSGAGQRGIEQLEVEREGREPGDAIFPHPISGNALPHIGTFEPDGYTTEERKMIEETRKILGDSGVEVSPTCVRIPVPNSHSESLNVELRTPCTLKQARDALQAMPGLVLIDTPEQHDYPLATDATGRDEVFVGRLRLDTTVKNGLALWVVADNVRKGAATNAVQIAELWARQGGSAART